MRRTTPGRDLGTRLCLLLLPAAAALSTRTARAECASAAGLSPCFDANALWAPAGSTEFVSLPDTRTTALGKPTLGVSSELLHRPVLLHAASPDPDGRDVHVVDTAVDASLFGALALTKDLELSLVAPLRVYQDGAGVGGVASQSAPEISHTALRDPRLGVGYSLDDTLHAPGLGLRLGLDVSLPLGNEQVFSGERSFVALPSATVGYFHSPLRVGATLGLRLRQSVDFGGVHLGNQAFIALGAGVEVLNPGLLFVALEAFGSPALMGSRSSTANAQVSDEYLFPAEWLASVHSSFGTANWSFGLGAGSGIPLSSETVRTASGPSTSHFLGVTTPDFRSLLVARYTFSAPR